MTTTERWQRPDASMTLLTEMMQRPLDPGYAAEVERREAAGLPGTPPLRRVRLAIVLGLLGALVTSAGMALRQPRSAVSEQKSVLISQIQGRSESNDRRLAAVTALQAQIAQARTSSLQQQDQTGLLSRLTTVEAAAGAVAVTGAGVTVTVDDAKGARSGGGAADPRASDGTTGSTVQARDLVMAVNGLWRAGAEAIAINGRRLTPTSAIRFAGQAILVDYRPLAPPYVIDAIGPAALRADFEADPGGQYLKGLADQLGLGVTVAARDRLTLPAGNEARLRYVTSDPAATDAATPSSANAGSTSTTSPQETP